MRGETTREAARCPTSVCVAPVKTGQDRDEEATLAGTARQCALVMQRVQMESCSVERVRLVRALRSSIIHVSCLRGEGETEDALQPGPGGGLRGRVTDDR